MVWEQTKTIMNGYQTHLPEWLDVSRLVNGLDVGTIRNYAILHDCGKPECLVIGDDGRRHFPDHAKVSERVAMQLGCNDDVTWLIANDMWMHMCSSEDVHQVDLSRHDLIRIQVLVAFAEIHANATMFGGVQTTSFKIKYKHVVKRAKVLYDRMTINGLI